MAENDSPRGAAISEAARRTGLSADTLRYYESIGLLPPVARDKGGRRLYGDDMIRRASFIKECRGYGLSLSRILGCLPPRQDGAAEAEAEAALLSEARASTEAMIELLRLRLERIDGRLRQLARERGRRG